MRTNPVSGTREITICSLHLAILCKIALYQIEFLSSKFLKKFCLYFFLLECGLSSYYSGSVTIHTLHTHQHRLDRNHNVLLLFIPGLIFTIVIGVYLILRVETAQSLQTGISAEAYGSL